MIIRYIYKYIYSWLWCRETSLFLSSMVCLLLATSRLVRLVGTHDALCQRVFSSAQITTAFTFIYHITCIADLFMIVILLEVTIFSICFLIICLSLPLHNKDRNLFAPSLIKYRFHINPYSSKMTSKLLILLLLLGVVQCKTNQSDPLALLHSAIFLDNNFVCSGVLTSKYTVESAATCGYECGGLWPGRYSKPLERTRFEAIFQGHTIEPIHEIHASENVPESLHTESFVCNRDEDRTMQFKFRNSSIPSVTMLPFASKEMLPYGTELLLYGYSSVSGATHCQLTRARVMVVEGEACGANRREVCVIYVNVGENRQAICNLDTGSPVYLDQGDKKFIAGVVTSFDYGKLKICSALTTITVQTLVAV